MSHVDRMGPEQLTVSATPIERLEDVLECALPLTSSLTQLTRARVYVDTEGEMRALTTALSRGATVAWDARLRLRSRRI